MKRNFILLIAIFIATGSFSQGWVQIPTAYEDDFKSIHFYNSNTGMLVGQSGTILRIENGEVNTENMNSDEIDNINSVFMTSPNTDIVYYYYITACRHRYVMYCITMCVFINI